MGSRLKFGNRSARRGIAAALGDNGPLRAALESLNVNCFVADLDLSLVWMNRKAAATVSPTPRPWSDAAATTISVLMGGSITCHAVT